MFPVMAETITIQEDTYIHNSDGIPTDTWGTRLAIVRQKMGWNVTEAARECRTTATSWQNWENGKGCREMHRMASKIAGRTGLSFIWLVAGGPLSQADPEHLRSKCFDFIDLRVLPGGGKSRETVGQLPLPMLSLMKH